MHHHPRHNCYLNPKLFLQLGVAYLDRMYHVSSCSSIIIIIERSPSIPISPLLSFEVQLQQESEDSFLTRLLQFRRRLHFKLKQWYISAQFHQEVSGLHFSQPPIKYHQSLLLPSSTSALVISGISLKFLHFKKTKSKNVSELNEVEGGCSFCFAAYINLNIFISQQTTGLETGSSWAEGSNKSQAVLAGKIEGAVLSNYQRVYNIAKMNSNNVLVFARLCGMVKNVKRAGWLRYLKQEQVESVADHSYRIAALTLALRGNPNFDQTKCLQMALIHDIGEGLVGDYTPHCKITPEQKFQKQYSAIQQILEPLGQDNAKYYLSLWMQYQEAKTYESWIVKDLDKFQMIQQAFEYQSKHEVDLKQFYDCVPKMKTDEIKSWANELLAQRTKLLQERSSANKEKV